MESPRPYTFDRFVRLIIFVAVLVGAFFMLKLLKGVLLPFLVAWLAAYMLHPTVCFFQTKCRIRNRIAAVSVTLFLILLLLFGICAMIVPLISDEVIMARNMIEEYFSNAKNLDFIPQSWKEYLLYHLRFEYVLDYLSVADVKSLASEVFEKGMSILSGTITFLFTLFGWLIALLYLVFILIDYDKINNGVKHLIPGRHQGTVFSIWDDVEKIMNTYFRGQALVALCVGILFSIGFSIVGLPLAILLGLFIGLLNLVPYLQVVGFVPAILLIMLQSAETGESFWWIFLWVLVVFCVVQAIQDLFLVPKIMGKAVGLNPALILLSLSVWGVLLGFIGIIIALPLTSLCISYYHKYVLKDLNSNPPDNKPSQAEDTPPADA